MMFERFTDGARHVIIEAHADARRLGHNYIGCEHLLLAAAAAGEPASAVLRDQGVTPERIKTEILRVIGRGRAVEPVDPLGGLDREALAAIGIDLDMVRARIEAAFGPDALVRAVLVGRRPVQARRRSRRPAWGKGPVADLVRRSRFRRARRYTPPVLARRAIAPRFPEPAAPSRLPFTSRAKESLALSLREATALQDNHIGVQHLLLALLTIEDGMVPVILQALGASSQSLRVAILDRYRRAS